MPPIPVPRTDPVAGTVPGGVAQPSGQALPQDLLALLVALDRSKRTAR